MYRLYSKTRPLAAFITDTENSKDKMIHEIDKARIQQAVRIILEAIGENPDRAGLVGTPDRIARMYEEIYRGYQPEKHPKITTFQNGADGISYDTMITDKGDFYSICEHHLMPFFGRYVFAYIPHPKGKILGLSKIARVVDYHAAKLQIQERLVSDIVKDIEQALGEEYPPLGIALFIEGEHLCKTMRGARKKGKMSCAFLTGVFKENPSARAEFIAATK